MVNKRINASARREHLPEELRANSDYVKEIHDKSIYETLSKGEFRQHFCKRHNICRTTFNNWAITHKSFAEAIGKGLNNGEAYWMMLPLKYMDRDGFNFNYWQVIMNNVFNCSKMNTRNLGDKTPEEIVKIGTDLYGENKISDKVLDKLLNIALTKVKIYESTTMKADIELLKAKAGITDN